MDWKDAAIGVASFAGGFFVHMLKAVMPGYSDLVKEVTDLRTENRDLMDKIRGLEDTIRDHEESAR